MQHPNIISKSAISLAWAYTYSNRARFYEKFNHRKSVKLYIKSIKLNPFQTDAYKGFLKLILKLLS